MLPYSSRSMYLDYEWSRVKWYSHRLTGNWWLTSKKMNIFPLNSCALLWKQQNNKILGSINVFLLRSLWADLMQRLDMLFFLVTVQLCLLSWLMKWNLAQFWPLWPRKTTHPIGQVTLLLSGPLLWFPPHPPRHLPTVWVVPYWFSSTGSDWWIVGEHDRESVVHDCLVMWLKI